MVDEANAALLKAYGEPRRFAAGADAHSVSYREGFEAGRKYATATPTRLLIVADTNHIDDISGIPHRTITEATLILSIIEDGSVKVLHDRYGITQGVAPGSWLVHEGARDGGWQVFPEEAGR